jgi:triphosphoribosyl-dephospho-CoA synthase
MTADAEPFSHAVIEAVAAIPPTVTPWGRGWCAAVASMLEAAAAKPGNVHPRAWFADLAFGDLVAAGVAIAAPLDAAPDRPLGETILMAVQAATAATPSNANLGIILLVAPLAAVPGDAAALRPAAVDTVLARLDASDAKSIWEAFQIARPGGLGKAERHDLAGPAPPSILDAMRLAAERDTIARLWAHGFEPLIAGPVADIAGAIAAGVPLETAIIRGHLRQLARQPDSLIARRHGEDVAAEVSVRAAAIVALEGRTGWRSAVDDFDASLRTPHRLNPGTTADLIAAALFILLWDGRLRTALPRPGSGPFFGR